MPDTKQIYQRFADRYDALVCREDYEGHLLPAILQISDLRGKDVIELGAGTGRLTRLLAPLARSLTATDLSFQMLNTGKRLLADQWQENLGFTLASHRALPLPDYTADVVISGWSFCYAAIDAGEDWQPALQEALIEVQRVLRPSGCVILIESLGTGYEHPNTPPVLINYLRYLNQTGLESTWIRTDYCFKDRAEAQDLTQFFFGEKTMPMWEIEEGVIVPECTGLWWKRFT
ncbi:MAG: class I SAM-dependent methyltransferase [Brevefilum sp.]